MNLEIKNPIQRTVLIGVLAALLAVLSQISIPLPSGVPVTLQTFAVALCGYVLGSIMGVVAVSVYLVLGAIGLPVLAGFSGGLGAFVGVTGGFLWGFLPMVVLCGLGIRWKSRLLAILLGIVGMMVCHLCGTVQFSLVTASPFEQAFLLASAPYLIKDVVSVALANFAALGIVTSLKKAGLGDAV